MRYLKPFGIGVAYKREPDLGAFVGPTVELGLPLFDRGDAAVARAEAEYRRADDRVAALSIDIRSEARAARDRVVAAYDAARHYEKVLLPLQQTIVSETLKLYNGMLLGTYDLLLARQAQTQTARQYIASVKEFWLAWTELERALGGKIALATSSDSARPSDDSSFSAQPHHHGDQP
jgi:cobalt-zinc-cadmium efflux system outer membrane protein